MTEVLSIRGRQVGSKELEQIRGWLEAHPQWSRRRLSQEVARQWDWRTPIGQLKDIAARDLLNRLEAGGWIRLPARQRRGGRQQPMALGAEDQPGQQGSPWAAMRRESLLGLLPLRWQWARPGQSERAWVARCLQAHHYLGYPDPLGQIHYLVRDRQGRELACLLFGPACWKVAAREAFIGWSDAQRQKGLGHLANNSRFLIVPWIKVPGLASHVLAGAVRHLRADWPAQTGRPLWLLESFVERGRFVGTCYRAANWLRVGQTQGRTRNDRRHEIEAPIKDVYLLPVLPDGPRRLCGL